MTFLIELWLPIVLSAVFVFVVSSIIHMVLPMHKSDMKKLPNEEAVLEALRANGVAQGSYMFPRCESMKDMGSPEMTARLQRGPVGWMTVYPPGGMNLGASLISWFLYCLIIGILSAYAGWHALGPGASYLGVFRIIGTCAMLGYAVCRLDDSIWKGTAWSTTFKFFIDGTVYALVTAGTFGWLWPAAG